MNKYQTGVLSTTCDLTIVVYILVLVVVFFPIMFVFILCVFCSTVMFRLLFLMFMHIRLICALIKITYLLTYLLTCRLMPSATVWTLIACTGDLSRHLSWLQPNLSLKLSIFVYLLDVIPQPSHSPFSFARWRSVIVLTRQSGAEVVAT